MKNDEQQRIAKYPIGASIDLSTLASDPYPTYAALRENEPVSWVRSLGMYFLTRYDDVCEVLQDHVNFIVGTERSTVYDTFGEHMMTVEGNAHSRYKSAHQPFFLPPAVRNTMTAGIRDHANALIDEFRSDGESELRQSFASRLPILTMLSLFGIELEEERHFRAWYDDFEAALGNFTWDEAVRAKGRESVNRFHELIQRYLDRTRDNGGHQSPDSLLAALLKPPQERRLADDEIRRNASIIFFGGISTVEALILNTLYALAKHPEAFQRVSENPSLISTAITESIRWLSPVQSATRHVAHDIEFSGHKFRRGDTVNCMLAAANRDPSVFNKPDVFDLDRSNANRHVGFAVGPHHCLGSHLARAEARIAVELLLQRLPGLRLDPERLEAPEGYEFRRPASAVAAWSPA